MKILKYLLFGVLGFIGLALVAALFVKKEYAVVREVTISKPVTQVFPYLKLLKNQDNFSVWNQKDPNMKKEYKGTDGMVGFVSAWESDNKEVGKGEQEIAKITENERVDIKLRFKIPFEAEDNAYFVTEMIDSNTTKVKWGFDGAFPYPMNLMSLFIDMDKEVGKDLEDGLTSLKALMEKP